MTIERCIGRATRPQNNVGTLGVDEEALFVRPVAEFAEALELPPVEFCFQSFMGRGKLRVSDEDIRPLTKV